VQRRLTIEHNNVAVAQRTLDDLPETQWLASAGVVRRALMQPVLVEDGARRAVRRRLARRLRTQRLELRAIERRHSFRHGNDGGN